MKKGYSHGSCPRYLHQSWSKQHRNWDLKSSEISIEKVQPSINSKKNLGWYRITQSVSSYRCLGQIVVFLMITSVCSWIFNTFNRYSGDGSHTNIEKFKEIDVTVMNVWKINSAGNRNTHQFKYIMWGRHKYVYIMFVFLLGVRPSSNQSRGEYVFYVHIVCTLCNPYFFGSSHSIPSIRCHKVGEKM